jgi:anti-anti-sigma factor
MTTQLEIRETPGGPRHCVLEVSGTLDTSGITSLTERCRAVMESDLNLVLNLAQVVFVSSGGIGGLVALSEDFRERGLDVHLSAPTREVLAPIELLCFDRFLKIYDSDEDAGAEWAA